jgi:hypothetical protein
MLMSVQGYAPESGAGDALKEWQALAKSMSVRVCELKALASLLDASDKGTMTNFEVAQAWNDNPISRKQIKHAVQDAQITCEDAPGPHAALILAPKMGYLGFALGPPALGGGQSLKTLKNETKAGAAAQIAKLEQDAKEEKELIDKMDLEREQEKAKKAAGFSPLVLIGLAVAAFLILRSE